MNNSFLGFLKFCEITSDALIGEVQTDHQNGEDEIDDYFKVCENFLVSIANLIIIHRTHQFL